MAEDLISVTPIASIDHQMVAIPAGSIELRDDRTKEKWTVVIEPFLLGKFLVTQDLYFEITQQSPAAFKGSRRPVETVSWQQAVSFCNALSVRGGLQPCYSLPLPQPRMVFACQQKPNGNMPVKQAPPELGMASWI